MRIFRHAYIHLAQVRVSLPAGKLGNVFVGFTSGGKESGCAFGAMVQKIGARKRYIEPLPTVPKNKRSCLPQGERSAVGSETKLYMAYQQVN